MSGASRALDRLVRSERLFLADLFVPILPYVFSQRCNCLRAALMQARDGGTPRPGVSPLTDGQSKRHRRATSF